jgi:hypothetical protein
MSTSSLLGMDSSTEDSFVTLVGMLSLNPSNPNQWLLEDGQGQVLLDMSHAVLL